MADMQQPESASVLIEAKNLAARVLLAEETDVQTLSVHLLISLARERGVEVTPPVEAALTAVIERFKRNPEPINEVFTRATLPEHGEPGYIEWLPGFDPEAPDEQQAETEDGKIDFYAKQSFVRVHKEDHVATIHPPTDGTDGRDVTGRTISASSGKLLSLTIDPSMLQLNDGRVLAQIDGLLVFDGKKLKVDPVLMIQGTVDFSTGNIDFEGDVVIRHDIRDKFRVKATGNVTIDGLIDASHIDCGGLLTARRGVAGRNEGTLEVGGDAHVGYLDQVSGHVKGTLHFTRVIIHSTMSVGGDLVSDVGRIIGGCVTVLGDARIAELGSDSETPTELRLTAVPDEASPAGKAAGEMKNLLHEIDTMQMEVETLKTTAGTHNPVAAERMTELTFEISDAESTMAKLTEEFPQLSAVAEDTGCDSTLDVMKKIHGRVTLTIGSHTVVFSDMVKGPVQIWLEGTSEVMCRFGEGEAQPIKALTGVTDRAAA